jgi:hypothetical protein
MPIHPGRLAGLVGAGVLALSLALPLPPFQPTPVVAQAPILQLTVEEPAAGSEVRGTVAVSGWAVDPATASGTGIVPDSVEVWLVGSDGGRQIGSAGYGDPRPDVAARFGNRRFLSSGFRYFWNSCDVPPGAYTLNLMARSSGSVGRQVVVPTQVTVGSCDLQMGESATGQVITGGQADSWTFPGTAGERVAITLDGIGGWDTLLELIGPDGSREDVDDDGGPDLNSWLSRRLNQTGTYTVMARPLSSEGCTGDYVMMGWLGAPGQSNPNRAAGAEGPGASFTNRASLRQFGERQAWTFTAEQGNELILYLPRNVGSRLDPFVELMAPDGQLLARDDDGGGGLNSFLQGVLPQGGEHTLVVRSVREDCGGEYLLRVDPDWGAESQLRGNLPYSEAVPGSLNMGTRRDVWSFPATAGERVTLTLDPNAPIRLQIVNPDGSADQARASRGRPLGLSFVPSESGTFNALVLVDTSRPVEYDLTLERGFGRLVSELGPVPLGQRVPGEIRFAEGRDLYTLDGRQGQRVRIALDRVGRSQLDPYLELLDPDGRTLAEDDDSGGELNSLIQVELPRTGTYTIVARGLADSAGDYALTVNVEGAGAAPGTAPAGPGTGPAPTGPGATPTPTPGPRGPADSPTPTPSSPGAPGPATSPSPVPTPSDRPGVPPTGPVPSQDPLR